MKKYLYLGIILLSFSSLSNSNESLKIESDCKINKTCKKNTNKNIKDTEAFASTEGEVEELSAYELSVKRKSSQFGILPKSLNAKPVTVINPNNGIITDSTGTYKLNNSVQGKSTVNIHGKVTCSGNSKVVIANRVYC